MSRRVAKSLLLAFARDVRILTGVALRRLVLGVQCEICRDYYRGPRTLWAHRELEHTGDPT